MQFKLIKKHDINSQNSTIMIFSRFYKNELNAMRFLNQFKLLSKNYEVKNVTLIKKFLKYCELKIQKKVKTQENYIVTD